jgi:Cu+-exporting ATPase
LRDAQAAEINAMLDPICDMTVDPARTAGKADFEGATYFFCSVHCQKLFQSDPAKILAAAKVRQSSQPSGAGGAPT